MIVAGGGTGSVTVFMGEQLNHTNGEIVHLDLSAASMHIAQTRAKIRGLRNIIWIQKFTKRIITKSCRSISTNLKIGTYQGSCC